MPLGAVLISDRLMAELTADDRSEVLFSNGFTYSAHPSPAQRRLKNIEIMERGRNLCSCA